MKARIPAAEYPSMARLAALQSGHARRQALVAALRALLAAAALHALALPLLAWASARHPHDLSWVIAILASAAVYAWPAGVLLWGLARASFRKAALAEALDRHNPGAPDPFRILLSLENHDPATLAALEKSYARLEGIRMPALRISPFRFAVLGLAAAAGTAIPFLSDRPDAVFRRMVSPLAVWKNLPRPRLEPLALPAQVAHGDSLRVILRVLRLPEGEPVFAHWRARGRETRYVLARSGDSAFFRHGPVGDDLTLRFTAPGARTGEYRVRAVPPPGFRSLSLVVSPPAYTRLPPETIPEAPAMLPVLPGSALAWKGQATQPLRALEAVFREEGAAPETLSLGGGPREDFAFQRSLRRGAALDFRMVSDGLGIAGAAGPYRIEMTVDAPPEIAFLAPDGDQDLGRGLKTAVAFRARDDFGIARVRLRYTVYGDQGPKSDGVLDVTSWLQGGGLGGGIWDLEGLELYPGNRVEAHLEAVDNDTVSGPKTARSQSVTLRMPSLEEILAEVQAEEQAAATSLRSAAEREERLRRERAAEQSPRRDGPAPLGEWEVERILRDQPRRHLQRLERHLQRPFPQDAKAGRRLQGLAREAKAMEGRLPSPDVARLPLSEQMRRLEALAADQKKLSEELEALPPPPPGAPALERKSLEEELARNRQEQAELGAWMREQERERAEGEKAAERSAEAEERMREDMRQAMEQLESAMEKGLQSGTLSPELLEKMERIRELLEDVLPDSVRQSLQQAMEGQRVGLEEVQRNLREMMERRDGLREGLDRAIRMLEALRSLRALEELAGALRGLEGEQRALAERIPAGPEEASRARQETLRKNLQETLEGMDKLGREQKAFRDLPREDALQAARSMREAEKNLSPGGAGKAAAGQGAQEAARSLSRAAQSLENFLRSLQGGPQPAEIAALAAESLEFSRWLETLADPAVRTQAGWMEEEPALGRRVSQAAGWLRRRLEETAAQKPYDSEALRREASAIGFFAAADPSGNLRPRSDSLGVHVRKAARELLKWLAAAQDPSGGEGQGAGNSAGGGGGGGGGEGGMSGMAERLRGASGKQMAVNQATHELLRSFLEGRRGGSSGKGSGGEGKEPGEAGEAAPGAGAANAQQGVGEALESLAESADDAGGAARKLRQLAEEARGLENALRGRPDPESIRRQQERFQARLLEAANALEERGRDRKRRAEAFRGGPLPPLPEASPAGADRARELRRRRAWARELRLPPEQRRHLEWYYESLLER